VTRAEASLLARARWRDIKESYIADYLFIGGPAMPARIAATRIGVSKRTIERYRQQLRQDGRLA
jgi:hypothetical protein